mmetsp:Transcript_12585/g.18371  ORF Transcript_12585/g.18371 Transcript_12585/m.18371 type:complete len:140 (-) Transcript_12585:504-923(-)
MAAAGVRTPRRGVASICMLAGSSLLSQSVAAFTPPFVPAAAGLLTPHNFNPHHTKCLFSTASDADLEAVRVPELKDMLRSRGLKVGGRKAELIERLRGCSDDTEVINSSDSESESTDAPPIMSMSSIPLDAIVIEAGKS